MDEGLLMRMPMDTALKREETQPAYINMATTSPQREKPSKEPRHQPPTLPGGLTVLKRAYYDGTQVKYTSNVTSGMLHVEEGMSFVTL